MTFPSNRGSLWEHDCGATFLLVNPGKELPEICYHCGEIVDKKTTREVTKQ